MNKEGKINSFADLSAIVGNGTEEEVEKRKFTEYMKRIIADKNRKWLIRCFGNSINPEIRENSEDIAKKIRHLFDEQHSRNWILHLISNFLPCKNANQVALVKEDVILTCPISGYLLTDLQKIKVGDRDKHIGYSGVNSRILLSGIAVYELYKFAMECTAEPFSRRGQIVNYHLDKMRMRETENASENNKEKRAKRDRKNNQDKNLKDYNS
jgi:hypothetical protein